MLELFAEPLTDFEFMTLILHFFHSILVAEFVLLQFIKDFFQWQIIIFQE